MAHFIYGNIKPALVNKEYRSNEYSDAVVNFVTVVFTPFVFPFNEYLMLLLKAGAKNKTQHCEILFP